MPTRGLTKAGRIRHHQCESCANPTREQVTCARRTEIALAARALIVEKGLEGLRTRDIAAHAGINIATLHYHVPTKEALIGVVAESTRSEFLEIHHAHSRQGMTPAQMLQREIDDHLEMLVEKPEVLKVMSEFFERSRRDMVVRRIYGDLRKIWATRITEIFSAGVEDGSFRADLDAPAAADIFISALVGGSRHHFHDIAALKLFMAELQRCFVVCPASDRKASHD